MPANIYGDGGLYGTGLEYGRIAAGLALAQESHVRETALKATIIDERVNRWEEFTSGSVTLSRKDFKDLNNDPTTQGYAFYRLQSDAVLLDNGNIYRVRIGDGSLTDFRVYEQTITDPTIAAQWNAWSVLYSGTHYAVALAANGNTPHVYHSKSDGLYRDNTLKWSHAGIVYIQAVVGTFDALFVTVTRADSYETSGFNRVLDNYYTDDIMSNAPAYDPVNYRWSGNQMAAILRDDGSVLRFQSIPRYAPRAKNNGSSITVCSMPAIDDNTPTPPRIIRGLAGEVGHNLLSELMVSPPLSDGYYYLFYTEGHKDNDYEATASPGQGVHWQRSKDGIHWSEAVSSGTHMGKVLVETAGFVWFPAYDSVWRRPASPVEYDISNFVPMANFDVPRDNQEGGGELTVANPDNINSELLVLSDRRLRLEIGLKVEDGTYEYVQFNDWWIKRMVQQVDGAVNRISIPFGDVWSRLSSTLDDTFNFIGRLKWQDWKPGKRNKAFNYFFVTDTAPVENENSLTTKGIVLYTGWKGQNGTAIAHFSGLTGNPSLIFRYIDPRNYQRIEKQGSTLKLIDKVNNVDTQIDSGACSSDTSPTLKIIFRFEKYWAYVDDALIFSGTYSDQPNVKPGYVGFQATSYILSYFTLEDWEPVLNAEELIRTALAMGDYHDVITGNSSSEEVAIVWGPQTDAPTPADGLRQALEAVKWDLVWNDGRIRVGAFKDETVTRVIQDRIIKTDYVDEARRRINKASVDGNEDTWIETDVPDTQQRDRQISAYFDLPELSDHDSVMSRAQEEIRKGKMGRTPGGDVPLYFDLWRMDVVNWIDNAGVSTNVRIEGISAEIEQGMKPSQRETVDASALT